jgi:hypothetical protein
MDQNEAMVVAQDAQLAVTKNEGISQSVALAAQTEKAVIQSLLVMARECPRNEDTARLKILKMCKRPGFAELVEFKKPAGYDKQGNQKFIVGSTIRYAEAVVQAWQNIRITTAVVYEDDDIRRIKASVMDLESLLAYDAEITLRKAVERRSDKGRDVISSRPNSYGDMVYLVRATEDELLTVQNSQISKAIRTNSLRMIPKDILDEGIEAARVTLRDRDAKDPDAAKRKLFDAFDGLGVTPDHIEAYLGTKVITPANLEELRGIYAALRDGEAKWSDYMDNKGPKQESPAENPVPPAGPPAAPTMASEPEPEAPADAELLPLDDDPGVAFNELLESMTDTHGEDKVRAYLVAQNLMDGRRKLSNMTDAAKKWFVDNFASIGKDIAAS